MIARVGAFCSVFQTVQDSPAKSEEFCKPSHQFSKFRQIFANSCKFLQILANFHLIRHFFGANFIYFFGISRNATELIYISEFFKDFSEISQNLGRKNVQRPEKPKKKIVKISI